MLKKCLFVFAFLGSVFSFSVQAQASGKTINLSQSSVLPSNPICKEERLSREQVDVLKRSYHYGSAFDMGYSLAAIAWKESSAGKYPINVNDPSFGVHHIYITTAASRANIKGVEINKLALALINDEKLSASFAIKELLFWQQALKKEDRNWKNVWAAYNGGYSYKEDAPQEYSKDIQKKIKWLKTCLIPNGSQEG
jgi:hypothetical protein